jgi:hypothetical protein
MAICQRDTLVPPKDGQQDWGSHSLGIVQLIAGWGPRGDGVPHVPTEDGMCGTPVL